MEANKMQVGGDHYSATTQHWDFVHEAGLDYLAGQVTKYVTRWKKKGGIQDIKKAGHFLKKLKEVLTLKEEGRGYVLSEFLDANVMGDLERHVVMGVFGIFTVNMQALEEAGEALAALVELAEAEEAGRLVKSAAPLPGVPLDDKGPNYERA